MGFLLDSYRPAVLLAAAIQFVLFLRWLYRRVRNDELMRAFVADMALCHLPHIYSALHELCQRQGITLDDSPQIRWFDLNGKSH